MESPTTCALIYGLDQVAEQNPGFSLGTAVHDPRHPKAFKQAVMSMAAQYASGPTQSYGFVKQLLQKGMTASLDDMLELEAEYQQRAGESNDYTEGVTAFIEKRAPKFTGS